MTIMDFDEAAVDALIAKQNDAFRKLEKDATSKGQWVFTAAVVAEGRAFVEACVKAVREFEAFTEDMDPHGDHSMGTFEIEGKKVWFKIDLYNETYEYGSPDPVDTTKTARVLTILFPSDY